MCSITRRSVSWASWKGTLHLFVFFAVFPTFGGENTSCNYTLPNNVTGSVTYSDHAEIDFDEKYFFKRIDLFFDIYFFFEYTLWSIIIFGFCGNIVILVVWCGEPVFRPTTFFMKCLAVSDMILLLSYLFFTFVFGVMGRDVLIVITVFSTFCSLRVVSAHTTMAVVFTRWLAVYKPLKVNSLLTKRRVVVGYVLIILWCVVAIVPLVVILALEATDDIPTSSRNMVFTVINMLEVVFLALPVVLLIVFNVHMIYRLWVHNSVFSQGQKVSRGSDSSQHQRLFAAVLCLSVTTVLAYPLGVASRIYLNVTGTDWQDSSSWEDFFVNDLMIMASIMLEAFNSSVNVIYYLVFVSRFRQLFRHRCCCCCRQRDRGSVE